MSLSFDRKELHELMEDFFILTGMRMVLFDENFNVLLKFHSDIDNFCEYMRKNKDFNKKCEYSDRCSFERCKKSRALDIYKCHTGLTEATAPLIENGRTIGYMMFGQVADSTQGKDLKSSLLTIACEYGNDDAKVKEHIRKIKFRNTRQIQAAAKILDACTKYIINRELVRLSGKELLTKIDSYIAEHLQEEISISDLCSHTGMSRTRLYEFMSLQTGKGVSAYIRDKRLDKAKQLIKDAELSISDVSDNVGFSDYNYFLRVFKKRFGISPKKMMLSERNGI